MHPWISLMEKSIFLAPVLDLFNGEIQTDPKILIYLSEKSIYAMPYIYAYIWILQICPYTHAYMDFLDGEIHIVGTSSDFPLEKYKHVP
jgi:hypothetical protein